MSSEYSNKARFFYLFLGVFLTVGMLWVGARFGETKASTFSPQFVQCGNGQTPCSSCTVNSVNPTGGQFGFSCEVNNGGTIPQCSGTNYSIVGRYHFCKTANETACTQNSSDKYDGNWSGDTTPASWTMPSQCLRSFNGTFPAITCGRVQVDVQMGISGISVAGLTKSAGVDCATPPPSNACPYSSTQARVQKNETLPWTQNLTIKLGESFRSGSFHDNSGQFATDTKLSVSGGGLNQNVVNGQTITPLAEGTVTLRVTTNGKVGSSCEGSALVNVTVVPTNTPTPTPTPTHTPTPTPTPTGTPTPTPTPTGTIVPTVTPTVTPTPTPGSNVTNPNRCGGTCGSNSNCDGNAGYYCYIADPAKKPNEGVCRAVNCPLTENCVCGQVLGTTVAPVAPATPKTGSESWLATLVMAGLIGAGVKVFLLAREYWA